MTLLLVFAAACSDGLRVDPSTATIATGQTITLEAHRIPSTYQGIPWAPNRIEFGGEGAAVSAAGVMEARENVAGIVVQGVEPGTATIVSRHYDAHTPGLLTNAVATVTVVACLSGPTLTPLFATIQGRLTSACFCMSSRRRPLGCISGMPAPAVTRRIRFRPRTLCRPASCRARPAPIRSGCARRPSAGRLMRSSS